MSAINREDLIQDVRFEDNASRVENAEQLDEIIERWTQSRPTETVIETMEANDAIVGPVCP